MLQEWLFADLPSNTTQTVVSATEWSEPLQVGVWLLTAAVFGLTVWNYRTIRSPLRKSGLIGLRLLLLALLLFVFYEPTLLRETVQKSRNSIVLLFDQSESMEMDSGDGNSRVDRLMDYLTGESETLREWREESDVHAFAFDETTPQTGKRADGLLVYKRRSIQSPRESGGVNEELETKDIGAVLVFSDGAATGLGERLAQASGLDDESRRVLEQLDAPVHDLSIGTECPSGCEHRGDSGDPFAFHLNATEIGVVTRVNGYEEGTPFTVTLYEDGNPLESKSLTIQNGESEYSVMYTIVPRRLGTRVYSAVISPLPEEAYPENNEEHVRVKVMRDRLRVLQICGHPSWDQRFLRSYLKQDPDVDLISFFILVNPKNAFAISGKDTTLIPFPARELFVEELWVSTW